MPATHSHCPRRCITRSRRASRRRPGGEPLHPTGLLNTGICLPRLHPQLPLTLALGSNRSALDAISPLLAPNDAASNADAFLALALKRFAEPFASLLTGREPLVVSLSDSPEAYRREVTADDDKEPVGASVLISLGDYFHTHAFVGAYLEQLPRPLAHWLAAFLGSNPHTIGPQHYKEFVEMIEWAGNEDESPAYSEWGSLSEFDEWEKLSPSERVLAEKALKLNDLDTLERLLKPNFPTLRSFNAEYPEWARKSAPLTGDHTQTLKKFEKADPELTAALRPFFPNGKFKPAPRNYIVPDGLQGAVTLALWDRDDMINHTFDHDYERAMNAGEHHLCFARIDLEPSMTSIAAAQSTVRDILDYYHGLIRIHQILDERNPPSDEP